MSETTETYPAPDLLRAFIGAHKGLTQAQAAKQIGIVPAALTYYLKGTQRPRADVRQRIATWSGGAVPESSWLRPSETALADAQGVAVVPPPDEPAEAAPASERQPTPGAKEAV